MKRFSQKRSDGCLLELVIAGTCTFHIFLSGKMTAKMKDTTSKSMSGEIGLSADLYMRLRSCEY